MTGKDKCNILKQIRCKIARENGIPYHTEECKFKGECRGTCPKCEAELKYITTELEKIKKAGKQIAVAGIAAAVIATSVPGCARRPETEDPIIVSQNGGAASENTDAGSKAPQDLTVGEVPTETPTPEADELPAETPTPEADEVIPDTQDEPVIEGDFIGDDCDVGDDPYIEIDGDIGYAITGDFAPGFAGDDNSEQNGYTEEEIAALEIPTLQQAVEMSSKEVASYVVGQNRNALKVVWGAQAAPIPQPSTNVLENYDEYWVGITGIHVYFDSDNVITDVKVFIPADCLSDGTVIPETVK